MGNRVLHILQDGIVTHKWIPEDLISIMEQSVNPVEDPDFPKLISDLRRATQESVFVAINFYKNSRWSRRMILHLTHELDYQDNLNRAILDKIGS